MKRIFYLSILIGVIALVVGIGYFLRFRAGAPTETAGEPVETGPGGLPVPGEPGGGFGNAPGTPSGIPSEQPVLLPAQKFGLVADLETADFSVNESGEITLIQPTGQVVAISSKGRATTVSSEPIQNLVAASFAKNGARVLTLSGSRDAPQANIFEVAKKIWLPLDSSVQQPSWSPNDARLIYIRDDRVTGRHVIETRDIASPKTAPREIIKLHAEDISFRWITPETTLIVQKPSATVKSSLLALNLTKKSLSYITKDKNGLETLWNSAGATGLMFTSGGENFLGRGGRLNLIDSSGKPLYGLNFLTLPSKCVFGKSEKKQQGSTEKATSTKTGSPGAQEFLYCAIPRDNELLKRSLLPDDYLKRALYTNDDFYRINLQNGATEEVFADVQEHLDAEKLKIFGSRLYFVNRYDKKLYAIDLSD